jgi:hypothetical protein
MALSEHGRTAGVVGVFQFTALADAHRVVGQKQSTNVSNPNGVRIAMLICGRSLPPIGALHNVNASSPPVYATLRRSRRIWFTMPIGVSCLLSERLAWTEETSTLVVNAHGALILLNHEVAVGQTLTISDLRNGSERKCRVVMLGAKTSGMNEVGIELLQPFDDFWHAPNVPSDWAQFANSGKLLA